MSEFSFTAIIIIALIFIMTMTALILGRKTNFKMSIWKVNIEFAASERVADERKRRSTVRRRARR